ncbi:hypothetical protein FBQ82_11100 [Anaerolineae bacterium CFX7]|nr:hypothetical protein [Anaerolineae bacterium CFX7]
MMVAVPFELKLPPEQLAMLEQVAASRQIKIQVLEEIILAWVERESKLQRARETLKQFSRGIGNGDAPHDVARNHDVYLYQKS